MHYSQDFLNAKLQAIRECQAKTNFKPAPQVISGCKLNKPKKTKLTVEEKTAAQKAKGIIKSRKEKVEKALSQDKIFKMKPVDLSEKIPLKIDSRTTIYINPWDDPDEKKLKYKNRFNKTPEDTMKEKLGYTYQF